jgi:anti-anti-sigma factor
MVEFNFNESKNTLVCAINGRIGTDVNELFLARLTGKIGDSLNAVTDPAKLVVCFDLKNVTFISSSFIRTCIMISRQVTDGNFNIINASPVIKKTFKIAGLNEVLSVK